MGKIALKCTLVSELVTLCQINSLAHHFPPLLSYLVHADSTYERSSIVRNVFPLLRSHCNSLGLQFYGVHMYSALPSSILSCSETVREGEASDGLKTSQEDGTMYQLERIGVLKLAAEEIKSCQRLSAGPNFVVSINHGKEIIMV